jgi:hypothetical protein
MTTTDPTSYILFAGLLGAAIGFFGAAILASRTITRVRKDAWTDGYATCNREHARHKAS